MIRDAFTGWVICLAASLAFWAVADFLLP